jgi:hypothetical protein
MAGEMLSNPYLVDEHQRKDEDSLQGAGVIKPE